MTDKIFLDQCIIDPFLVFLLTSLEFELGDIDVVDSFDRFALLEKVFNSLFRLFERVK